MIVKEFQYPETGVGFTVVPINHGDARELGGKADQLRLARDINPKFRQLTEKIGVHRSSQVPIGLRNGL
jgi:hypothetical protein